MIWDFVLLGTNLIEGFSIDSLKSVDPTEVNFTLLHSEERYWITCIGEISIGISVPIEMNEIAEGFLELLYLLRCVHMLIFV